MGSEVATWGGWVLGLGTIVTTFVASLRKGKIDESALVFTQWKELLEAHKSQVTALAERVKHLEEANERLRERVRKLEDENAGLKRAIAQNSKSAAQLLGDSPVTSGVSESLRRSYEQGGDD